VLLGDALLRELEQGRRRALLKGDGHGRVVSRGPLRQPPRLLELAALRGLERLSGDVAAKQGQVRVGRGGNIRSRLRPDLNTSGVGQGVVQVVCAVLCRFRILLGDIKRDTWPRSQPRGEASWS